jgi:hypothetical protein
MHTTSSRFIADYSKNPRRSDAARVFNRPIEDLLSLSGYALIYSELDSKDFWSVAKLAWDQYFQGHVEPTKVSQFLSTITSYRRTALTMTQRDLIRAAWHQDFERRMRDRGLARDLIEPYPPEEKHASPLIRALARGGHVFDEPQDVFLVEYIAKRPESSSLELTGSAEALSESLEREKGAGPGSPNEDDI